MAALVAALACAGVLAMMLRFSSSRLPLDRPNARSLHDRPIPRVGGIAVLAGVALSAAADPAAWPTPLMVALVLAAVSLADDFYQLPVALRLVVHLAAASLTAWYLLSPMNLFALALIAIAIAWITNLYNFMDGSDGLAAGMTIIGFGAYAAAAWFSGDAALASACAALAGGALGFLAFNFHPARVFLGDVGSIPLGYLAAALGLVGWRGDLWPLWFPLLVFAPFIGDATVTLLRRALRGEKVWQAHREHYYQRLVRMGVGHRGTALIAYALMLGCASLALAAKDQAPTMQLLLVGASILVLVSVAAGIDRHWSRHARER